MLRWLGIIIGVFGTIVFSLPFFAGIFNAGSLAGTLLSVCLFLGCLRETALKEACRSVPWFRYACRITQAGYILFLGIVIIVGVLMYRECRRTPDNAEEHTVVVLGCGLEGDRPSRSLLYRLQAAEHWLKEHPETPVIVSGGQGSDEIMPEAQCMAQWLEDHGIGKQRIFREDRSSSTYENLAFSRAVLNEHALPEHIIIVTNDFHVYRACMIARRQGYTCTGLPAKTTPWLFPASALREVFGILYTWVTG